MFFATFIFDPKSGFCMGYRLCIMADLNALYRLCIMADFQNGFISRIFGFFSSGFLHKTTLNDMYNGF